MEPTNFFIPIVSRDLLCCIVCTVDPNEIRDSSAKSCFHWKTLKCRLLINMMPSKIVASPIFAKNVGSFFVITTNEFYKTGELQIALKKLNLTSSPPQVVAPKAYVDSIIYTIDFYLSPTWNKISHVHLEGHEFLENSEFNSGMICEMKLTSRNKASDDEIKLKLTAVEGRLSKMELEYLGIPSMFLNDFYENANGVIDFTGLGTVRVTVIPSLRKAIVSRVLKQIPANCPFKNYGEMRRHWKNMYGYRLPRTSEGMIFYEVYFQLPAMKVEYFLYPDICIRRELLQRPAAVPEALTKKFLHDLSKAVPMILNRPLQIFETSQQSPAQNENFQKASEMNISTPQQADFPKPSANTTRLSLSAGQPLKTKQTTTQMSPTPSLTGKKVENRKLNFQGLKAVREKSANQASATLEGIKRVEEAEKTLKMFLSNTEKCNFFRNPRSVNVFGSAKRKNDSLQTINKKSEAENQGETKKSKVKVVDVQKIDFLLFGKNGKKAGENKK